MTNNWKPAPPVENVREWLTKDEIEDMELHEKYCETGHVPFEILADERAQRVRLEWLQSREEGYINSFQGKSTMGVVNWMSESIEDTFEAPTLLEAIEKAMEGEN